MSKYNPFSWLRSKKNPVSGIMTMNAGQAKWTPRDYANLAREGYEKNNVFYSAVDLVCTGASQVDWGLFYRKENQIESHPILDLLKKPNPAMNKASFIYASMANYIIAGNSYINAVGKGDGQDGTKPVFNFEPTELWVNRPDRYKVIEGQQTLVGGYKYEVNGQCKTFPVDQVSGESNVLHWKTFHPLNDFYGMSCLEACAVNVDIYNESLNWNKSFFDNGARPSGALLYKGKSEKGGNTFLPDGVRGELKKELDESYSGAKNNGKPLLLEHLEWVQFSLSQKDMDFLGLKDTTAKDIVRGVGVPPILLNIGSDSTFSNMSEARLALWDDTILPNLNSLTAELNNWLVPRFGEDLELKVDTSKVTALEPRREKQWDRAEKTTFITINQKRDMVGMEPIEGGDELYISSSMIPLGFDATMQAEEQAVKKKFVDLSL